MRDESGLGHQRVYVGPKLNYGGTPEQILDFHTDERFELCLSPVIIEELRVTLRDRFEWPADRMETVLEPILSRAMIVEPKRIVAISRDPDDDHILACALEAKADVIVTGDKDLLQMHSFEEIPIITPRQFVHRLKAAE
jgi:putative PIN family toxin of toxin-antitoxin system